MSNADLISRLRLSQHRGPSYSQLRCLIEEAADALVAADKIIVDLAQRVEAAETGFRVLARNSLPRI
jgi:hypothetical protein